MSQPANPLAESIRYAWPHRHTPGHAAAVEVITATLDQAVDTCRPTDDASNREALTVIFTLVQLRKHLTTEPPPLGAPTANTL